MMPNFSFYIAIFGENLEERRTVEKHFVSVLLGRKRDSINILFFGQQRTKHIANSPINSSNFDYSSKDLIKQSSHRFFFLDGSQQKLNETQFCTARQN